MSLSGTYLLKSHFLISTDVFRTLPKDKGNADSAVTFSITDPAPTGGDYHTLARLQGTQNAIEFSILAVGVFSPAKGARSRNVSPSIKDLAGTYGAEALYDLLATAARTAVAPYFVEILVPLQAPEPIHVHQP